MKLLLYCITLLLSTSVFGQSTAIDFTATTCGVGCSSTTFNLFTELNSGKVIVLVWVMPCIGCIDGAKAADDAVKAFNTNHPGKASLWLIDDGPPSNCSTMTAWAASQQIGKPTIFGNYSNEIDQANYGGFGMPHIIVVGPDKTIYFNEMNGTGTGVAATIQAAYNATGVENINAQLPFTLYPNPAASYVQVNCTSSIMQVAIYDKQGRLIKLERPENVSNPTINMSGLASGAYFLQVMSSDNKVGTQKFNKY